MLSEMKPCHLWVIVISLLCIYIVIVFPIMKAETQINSQSNRPLSSSNYHLRTVNQIYIDQRDFATNRTISAVGKTKEIHQFQYKDFSNLVGWTSDFHISTVQDIKQILLKFKVKLIDKSLSGHCHLTGTCQTDLRVITRENGISLSSCPNRLRRRFYDEYRDDEEMRSVDFFLCTHASSMCELFMPFGKPIIVIASTRYEIGRHEKSRWNEWNQNLALIASKSVSVDNYKGSSGAARNIRGNVVAANNKYDQEYMQYFTGLRGIELFPSVCETFREDDGRPVSYSPSRSELLIAPSRDVNTYLAEQIIAAAAGAGAGRAAGEGLWESLIALAGLSGSNKNKNNDNDNDNNNDKNNDNDNDHSNSNINPAAAAPTWHTVMHIRALYPHFKYTDLAAHPAVILLPYQVSFMLFFELYSMNVPMFVPSPALLTDWHLRHNLLKERTWDAVYGHPQESSALPRHPDSPARSALDPNNEFSRQAILEWVSLADFYEFPHVVQFESVQDLVRLLASTDLRAVSAKMQESNRRRGVEAGQQWEAVLEKLDAQQRSRAAAGAGAALPKELDAALARDYSVQLAEGCHGHRQASAAEEVNAV